MAAPSNDDLANAIPVTGGTVVTSGTNREAGLEDNEPNFINDNNDTSTSPTTSTIWYSYNPVASGTLRLNTSGSTFDTTLQVYRVVDPNQPVSYANIETVPGAGDDDFGGASTSQVEFAVEQGRQYFVQVGGFGGARPERQTGDLNLNVVGPACYCTGSLIRTVRGEVAVENLAIGDHVVTASGGQRPITWIGHRAYAGRFVNANPNHLPVCFKAGALAEGVPGRDLWVSPRHAMFLDGVLVAAEHLVNGVSVVQAERVESVAYWHVELDSHDVLVAEGAASESYIDDDNRGMFHNAHEYGALYPAAERVEAAYCAPRVEDGYALEAIRRRLAERAGLSLPAAHGCGSLRGFVEGCDGASVWGWAWDEAHPDAPVCLDLLVDGVVLGLAYADGYRPDLTQAGIGDGCHAFNLSLPTPLRGDGPRAVLMRRSADGAVLADLPRAAPRTMVA